MIKIAKSYLKQGFSVIPVTLQKIPAIPSWGKYQKEAMTLEEADEHFKDAKAIAVLCGGKSRLFCLDADMKYDLSGDLWERFKKALPNSLMKKLYCQKTKNSGFHLVCIVPETRLFGNEKFASRYTTPEERHKTYMEAYSSVRTRDASLNIAVNDKNRVLFESRSGTPEQAGGYFLIPPSPGYEKVYGKFQEISEEEYDILVETARSFNEVVVEKTLGKDFDNIQWAVSPFEHYNSEGDVIDLLSDYGWTLVSDRGRLWRLKRPGNSPTKDSAIYDTETKILNVFSTSTSFDVGRGYSHTGVFIHLACKDDEKVGYRKLVERGWGKRNSN